MKRSLPLLAAAIVLTVLAYYPITDNYFHQDDFFYFFSLQNGSLIDFLFRPLWGHLFATRNAMFALWEAAFGMEVRWYFLVVLATHVLNVALAFRLIRLCTGSPGLACAGALLWGVSPLHEEVLGWLSVYGNALAATALLWLMQDLAASTGAVSNRRALGWVIAVLAMGTSGMGFPVALVFPLILLVLRPELSRRIPLFAGVSFALAAFYVASHWWFGAPLLRELSQQNTTMLPSALVTDVGDLVGVGVSGLLFGLLGKVPIGGLSLLAGLCWIGAVLVVSLMAPQRTARHLMAWGLIVAASYAAVFVGRVGYMSATDLWQTRRYHYVTSLGVAVTLCLIASWMDTMLRVPSYAKAILVWMFVAAVAIALIAQPRAIDHYAEERRRTVQAIAEIRARIAAAPQSTTVYIPTKRVGPRVGYVHELAALFVTFFPSDVVDGHLVRFIADDRTVAAQRSKTATRLAALLVTEREAQ